MKLSNEQLEEFNSNGFLILKNFANEELCNNILQKAKEHLKRKEAPIESEQEYMNIDEEKITVRRLRQVYDREEIFKDWMTNEEIRPVLKQVLNDTPVLTLAHHNSIMTKLPHESTRTFWHQDRRYWHFKNDDLVSVWLSLGDEFLENGLLEFIPTSHKIQFDKNRFDENSNFLDENIQNQELIKTKTSQNLKKGDVVLFHCKTLHHASKNQTNNPKISFVYTVRASSNKALLNTRSDFKEIILD
ncbi:phytanoyl-CoA dioxygenase family protein [Poseidonibacter ostreae]|jgi:phytanoyl-CoA hydroxylase|uniref:Phytanoyl-CoA dioxygenase family protein n=1 Tax=Poseidonibacter ostreae TaxID=2654171 RepID=A0A6L4WSV7_9BACT|nr:phytanoyl-CoA dioxygenase family protein [Poseidonibacter ostreae]KAB7885436.1 phytanoyl-CoA dioxygenase family protein [Poseidonibacter ostreae]KAB7887847.1 phytanoyl-CoA dioxygenase family protein [Poseidonibacter ostreae]